MRENEKADEKLEALVNQLKNCCGICELEKLRKAAEELLAAKDAGHPISSDTETWARNLIALCDGAFI